MKTIRCDKPVSQNRVAVALASILLASSTSSTHAVVNIAVTNPAEIKSSMAGNIYIISPKIAAADTPSSGLVRWNGGYVPETGFNHATPYKKEIQVMRTMNLIQHKKTGTTLSVGVEAWYENGERIRKAPPTMNFTYRSLIGGESGSWNGWKTLKCLKTTEIIDECVPDAGQYVVHENGNVFVPVSIKLASSPFRVVSVLRLGYDGVTLRLLGNSTPVTIHQGRGFLEPQLAMIGKKFVLSIRAENGYAYHAQSSDGQHFSKVEKWRFGSGKYLITSSTQQHFMTHKGHLWLLYVKKTDDNTKVVRYRDKLYIAMIHNTTNRLIESTEKIVFNRTDLDPVTTRHFGNFYVNGNAVYCNALNIIDWTRIPFKAVVN